MKEYYHMATDTLLDIYVDELGSLHAAECQLLKVLPRLAKVATSPQLACAFLEHTDETQEHIDRLDQIFAMLGLRSNGTTCEPMEALIEDSKEVVVRYCNPHVMDVALIAAVQQIDHYEMARYGCMRTYARLLGYEEAADLLQETLDEVAEADRKLTQLAEIVINVKAVSQMTFA